MSMQPIHETREFPMRELRVDGEDKPKIRGHAAVFDTLSVPLWGFREKIRRGAFAKTIQEGDVRALWNHDSNYVLGRTKSGTLRIAEDDIGLYIENDPPDTTWARDAIVTMRRGDVDQMSFLFDTVRDEWRTEGDETIRELIEVKLYDVSPTTFPAYEDTDVAVRSVLRSFGFDFVALFQAISRSRSGQIKPEDRELVAGFIRTLQEQFPSTPGQAPHLEDGDAETQARARLDLLRRQLELAELT